MSCGIAKTVQDEEVRAVFTDCHCHSLNLAANDCIKKLKLMKPSLETTHDITKLLNYLSGGMLFFVI